jgi:hypothetical protein
MIMRREGTTLSVAPQVQVADLQPGWPMTVDEGSCFDGVNSLIKHTRRMNKLLLDGAFGCRLSHGYSRSIAFTACFLSLFSIFQVK